ncbi:Nitric oxide synthase oxygenase [Alloactinosynnema sp. L-07]|uniref:nitric oxide synthase oxygenase n=1 Tax=Alloactinosynnema sp. L-07 TaxID=1653480 RepID=UPI00065EF44E|nr:nitric oxide synthase oxygenase [Alloactinosynnema sp. L-07]CRK60627.1 Nitric oxide synthase oxygenase [Alloactinosynnema sp. L-07]
MTALRDDVLPLPRAIPHTTDSVADLEQEAAHFLRLYHAARPKAGAVHERMAKVRAEIAATGTYRHTQAELAFGARVALRDSGWCPSAVPWRGLLVRDLRAVRDADTVVAECGKHLRTAGLGGQVRPTVTVFAPDTPWRRGPRIRNDQLVRYAGYRGVPDGDIGDRRYTDFTTVVGKLGWRPPLTRGAFDRLPLVVETDDEGITLHTLPSEVVREVALVHPTLPWFAELGLRWHAVPVISNQRLHIGGIDYPAAPYNGVYLCRAIGEDVIADDSAYGLARVIAARLGLDTASERTLWRDRVAVECNRAVLHSFDAAGVTVEHSAEAYASPASSHGRPAFLRQR